MTEAEKILRINSIDKEIKKLQSEKFDIEQAYNSEIAKYTDMYDKQLSIGDTVITSRNNIPHKGIIKKLFSTDGNWGQCSIEYELVEHNLSNNKMGKIILKNVDQWTWDVIKIN